jgi:hypothetical protein
MLHYLVFSKFLVKHIGIKYVFFEWFKIEIINENTT